MSFTHDTLLVTLGTAYVVYGVADSLPSPSQSYIRGVYPGDRFYRMGADSCGASTTDWASAILCPHQSDDPDALFDLAALAPSGANGITFNPELVSHQGTWQAMGIGNDRADLARAVLESLIRRMQAMVKAVTGNRPPVKEILAAGGHSKSPCYLEMMKANIGPTFVPTKANPLLGAARMALNALGS